MEELTAVRAKVASMEQSLLDGLHARKQARQNGRKLRVLLKLQRQEKALGLQRMKELESTVDELETRRMALNEGIRTQQAAIRKSLRALSKSFLDDVPNAPSMKGFSGHFPEEEKLEAPRRKVLANLAHRGLREIEALKADLEDADRLEGHIQEEKQQLAYLFQDLKEEESVLVFHQQLQEDFLKKKRSERIAQLENYHRLKSAEAQVEGMIGNFNARKELERAAEEEKRMTQGVFAQLKGKLGLPVADGKVISAFGRAFDPRSRLYVFKKGIDIVAGKDEPVYAISSGKIAYSGQLPNYGQVEIIDHGQHFYSLCAHLGSLMKKPGDFVAAGETIGTTDDAGTPIYFEIRDRNIAVNPLQWVSR